MLLGELWPRNLNTRVIVKAEKFTLQPNGVSKCSRENVFLGDSGSREGRAFASEMQDLPVSRVVDARPYVYMYVDKRKMETILSNPIIACEQLSLCS